MINRSNLPDHVDRSAHPAWLLVAPSFVLILFILSLFIGHQDYSHLETMKSAVVGLCIGLPVNLLAKWILRRNIDFYADLFLTEIPARFSKHNIACSLPSFVGVTALGAITDVEKLPMEPAYLIYMALVLLWYPEQKRIYLAAKDKLAEYREQVVSNQ